VHSCVSRILCIGPQQFSSTAILVHPGNAQHIGVEGDIVKVYDWNKWTIMALYISIFYKKNEKRTARQPCDKSTILKMAFPPNPKITALIAERDAKISEIDQLVLQKQQIDADYARQIAVLQQECIQATRTHCQEIELYTNIVKKIDREIYQARLDEPILISDVYVRSCRRTDKHVLEDLLPEQIRKLYKDLVARKQVEHHDEVYRCGEHTYYPFDAYDMKALDIKSILESSCAFCGCIDHLTRHCPNGLKDAIVLVERELGFRIDHVRVTNIRHWNWSQFYWMRTQTVSAVPGQIVLEQLLPAQIKLIYNAIVRDGRNHDLLQADSPKYVTFIQVTRLRDILPQFFSKIDT
jgi:hypothetical protein